MSTNHTTLTFELLLIQDSFLANRTATEYDQISYWHNPVHHLSVMLCIVALRVGVPALKLYQKTTV